MTPSLFDPGLESITVAETELSDVDGELGELLVRGYPIAELAANATYEESVALLLDGHLPSADALAELRSELAAARELSDHVDGLLRAAAAEDCDPMDALRMGIAAATLGSDATEPATLARRVIAVTPTVVATYWRYREGLAPVDPDPDLGHAANYRYMVTGDEPTDKERRALETFLTTMIDHGLNPSTFTARTVVSTESDLVSAATAAVGTLKGPRHGGNLRAVFDLLRTAHEADDVAAVVEQRLAEDERLPGFGHRVYEVRDPRAAVLSAALERLAGAESDAFQSTVRALEAAGTAALRERRPGEGPAPTVEFYAAALLYSVGIPPSLFTPTFAVARAAGWMAHCLEQRANNHLVRPVSRYVGPTGRTWTPVEERGERGASRRDAVEPVSEALGTLADPARLEILSVLADADGTLAYSTLRERTAIEDKGRFNYHLRQLRGSFVTDREDGYALGEAGERFVEAVLQGDVVPDE